MKKLLVLGLLLVAAQSTAAQEAKPASGQKKKRAIPAAKLGAMQKAKPVDQATLKKRYEAKLLKPFVQKADWVQDYDEARAAAARGKKLIFAYFTRSYSP